MTVGNNRGYLKDSGGSKRLRFVKTGYDATDETVPPNQVIFDSQDIGLMSILEVGSYTWTTVANTGGIVQVKSWSYGFTPLCMFQWTTFQVESGYWRETLIVQQSLLAVPLVKVDTTGIYVNAIFTPTGTWDSVSLRWYAFGIPADS